MALGFSQGVSLGDAFIRGRERRRNQPLIDEQNDLLRQKQFLELDNQRKGALFQDAQAVNSFLKAGQTGKALNVLSNRLSFIEQFGGDPSDTREIADLLSVGNIQGATSLLDSVEDVGIAQGFLSDPLSRKKSRRDTADIKEFDEFQRLITTAKQTGNSEDEKRAEQFGRKSGFIRATEQQKSDIKVTAAERKAVAKANVARRQGFIDSGVEAANGVATLNRSIDLLKEVETGGFANVALKAKRIFGIESADEGELSNLLGKAVLAQLKPTFGAAFTAREGELLSELEGKFSNSVANNTRLLQNALKLADRAARRGIAAAENQGDNFTADEIRSAMAFTLQDKDISETPIPGQTSTIGRFQVEVQ